MLYALAAAVAWGVVCGLFRTHYWTVVVGGLLAAALSLWLERENLAQSAGPNRTNFYLQLVAAGVFVAIVGVGIVSVSYWGGEYLKARLGL